MNATNTAREARSRNLARLRRLTIGTAALGVAATSGFGWLAAMTYTGATTGSATAYTTSSGATATESAQTSTTTSSAVSSAVSAPTVTSTSGVAHVSSGGS